MRFLAAIAATAALAFAAPAHADLLIKVDKSIQQMTVSADGKLLYTWPVSTGIAKYDTPNGAYTPFRKEKDHFSQEWDDAPMPYSIFFTMKGHAIHGTNHSNLGHAASHGCVRLSVAHAAVLWDLVAKHKMAHTTVVLTGAVPNEPPAVAHTKQKRAVATATRPDVLQNDAEVLQGMPRDQQQYGGPLRDQNFAQQQYQQRQYQQYDEDDDVAPPPRPVYRQPRYYDDRYPPRYYGGPPPYYPYYGR